MKKITTVILILTLILTASAFANDSERVKEYKDIKHDIISIKSTNEILFKMNQAIDLWHRANLEGNYKKVVMYEQKIFDLIADDLSLTLRKQMSLKNEADVSRREIKARHNNADTKDAQENYLESKADKKYLDDLLKSKKRLAKSIRKSDSFSYKYRLLNDYLHLLNKEVASERVEVAEDFGEWQEDR